MQRIDVFWNYNSENAELLLFVLGGGWLIGDKKQYREMASGLAENGITVVLIIYRLSPMVKFPDHIEDVAAANCWAFGSENKF